MKRRSLLLFLVLAFCFSGCSRFQEVAHVTETSIPADTQAIIETFTEETQPVLDFTYEELKYYTFYFSSGAGGWHTELTVESDGTFSGYYEDFSAGSSGEGYDANVDRCDFTGAFTQARKVNDYTYALQLARLDYDREPKEEIIDRVRYGNADPFGLTGGKEFLLYLPGAPLEELPQEYRGWVGYYDLTATEDTALPFYGLYNVTQECGFSSFDIIQTVREAVAAAEEQEEALKNRIYEDSYASQADMNTAAASRYELWDGVLNQLWGVLKQTLDAQTMKDLTREELVWIDAKEAAVAEAGKEVEGGSLYPLVTGAKAAELTRERVYELLEYLK